MPPTKQAVLQLGTGTGKAAALIQLMTDRIVAGFDPLQVILFGSFARGDANADSDIDLLVVLPQVSDKPEAMLRLRQAVSDVPVAKDVLVTTPEEIRRRGDMIGPILRPALKEGKVLYAKAGCRLDPGMNDEDLQQEVRRWLQYAREDLQGAGALLEEAKKGRAAPRQACFWAQQSAEKALKAILVFEQTEYPRTHNVTELLQLLPDTWASVKNGLPDLRTLSSWAVQARYPDSLRDATQAEAESALQQAHAVWASVSGEFAVRGIDVS